MKTHYLSGIPCEGIAELDAALASGEKISFCPRDKAPDAAELRRFDEMCSTHGAQCHFGLPISFPLQQVDCRVLQYLPNLQSLAIVAQHVDNIEYINVPYELKRLIIHIYRTESPDVLAGGNLKRLEFLDIGEQHKNTLELSPISEMRSLRELKIMKQDRGLSAIAALGQSLKLLLKKMRKGTNLEFISRMARLDHLTIELGGREDLAGVHHPTLSHLYMQLIQGFLWINLADFPGLKRLGLGDLRRLRSLDVSGTPWLETLTVFGLPSLQEIAGLKDSNIARLSLHKTSIDFERLISEQLPSSLKFLQYEQDRVGLDRRYQERISDLGLCWENPVPELG